MIPIRDTEKAAASEEAAAFLLGFEITPIQRSCPVGTGPATPADSLTFVIGKRTAERIADEPNIFGLFITIIRHDFPPVIGKANIRPSG